LAGDEGFPSHPGLQNYTMSSLGGKETILKALAEAKARVKKLCDAIIVEIQTVVDQPIAE
jgi:hypothetical protein